MGDPRRARKKYQTPSHPWQKKRIEEEKELVKEFGFKNKKEIWKLHTWLRQIQRFIKKTVTSTSQQILMERKMLLDKLHSYNLISENATLDDVLSLTLRDVLNRRLQTLVFKKGMARTMKQARQYIVHRHVMVNGKIITSPNHLVRASEDSLISFYPTSSLNDPEHPERKFEIKEEVKEEISGNENTIVGSSGDEVKKSSKKETAKKGAKPKKKATAKKKAAKKE
jgi:small subunit ribosomal protein S4